MNEKNVEQRTAQVEPAKHCKFCGGMGCEACNYQDTASATDDHGNPRTLHSISGAASLEHREIVVTHYGAAQATPIDRDAVAAVQQKLDSLTVYGKPNAQAAPEGADDEDEFTIADRDHGLNELLNLAADMAKGNANMDTAMLFEQHLESVLARLAATITAEPVALEQIGVGYTIGGRTRFADMGDTFPLGLETFPVYRAAPSQQVEKGGAA